MLEKESVLKDRRNIENQLEIKLGNNIVVDWMSEIRGLAQDGYRTSNADPNIKNARFQRIIGICDAVILGLKED